MNSMIDIICTIKLILDKIFVYWEEIIQESSSPKTRQENE